MPVSRSIARSNGVRSVRRSWKRALIRSTSGHELAPDLVHDVVAEALEQAHHRLGLAEQAPLLVAHQPLHPVLAAALAAQRPAEPAHRLAAHARGRRCRTASAGAPGATRGTAAARGAPRTRRRGSSRAGRSRSGTARAARPARAPSGGCSPRRTAAGPGAASADSSARSYWPRTRWPMNPSRNPSWRVVIQRLASAIVALARPPPGGTTWSSRSCLELADERREGRGVGPHPAGPIDDARALDDARQLGPERRRQGRHDPGHRRGVGGLGRAQLGRRQRARAPRRAGRWRSARRPASRPGPRARGRSMRRPTTVAAAPSAEPMRIPACQARSSRHDGRPRRRVGHRASAPSSTVSTSGKAGPNSRPARSWNALRVAGRAAGDASASRPTRSAAVAGASSPLTLEQLGQRRGRRRRRVDDRDAVAGDAPR